MAPDYDRRWARYNERSLALLPPLLSSDPGDVLDLACGTGNLPPRLPAVRSYTGVDASLEMLGAARRKLPATALAAADAAALPFADARFDTVVCASAFHVFPQPERALAEVRRVLRRPGRLLLLDWSRDALSMRALDLWLRLTGDHYRRMYTAAEATDLLRQAGFRIASAERRRIGWPWALMVIDATLVG
ncbi:MAG TPA: class I SAM-dependent methyltransferase [Longimicrobiaceae bacterium]|nr:class I SAM-dependent methyltransferase [Longimicrobiaceae bacterium]